MSAIQLQGLAAKAMALLHLEVNMAHDGIGSMGRMVYLPDMNRWFSMANVGKYTSLMDCLGVVGGEVGQINWADVFVPPTLAWWDSVNLPQGRNQFVFLGGDNSSHYFGESLLNGVMA